MVLRQSLFKWGFGHMANKFVRVCLVGLLSIHALLLAHSAKVHSPTWDEVGHLAAGISHWELGRVDLYSVNPPLVRTIAAAPVVLFCRPQMDWDIYHSDPSLRSEVYLGRRMIELNGENSLDHFFIARLAVLPIALIGGWLCFLWGRDLFGDAAGLIALALWTFSPNVLAYGSVITPDLGSAVAAIGSSYVFWRWMKTPNWSWSLTLMTAVACAMLTKSVWLMLPAMFLVIWVGRTLITRQSQDSKGEVATGLIERIRRSMGGQFAKLILVAVVALLLTNGLYGFIGSMKPLGDYTFVSSLFSGVETVRDPEVDCVGCIGSVSGNRFAGSMLAGLPIPLPANYLQGIDIQIRDFERGRHDVNWQSYLLGQWKQGGWWYYYIVGLFWKVPLATWLMISIGSVSALFWRPDRQLMTGVFCLWLPAIVLFVVVSACTGLNRYVRYVLPVLPVLFIWASQLGRFADAVHGRCVRGIAIGVSGALCLWLAVVSLANRPNHLSYFNEVAGGGESGHKLLCDSNIDWGQDLLLARQWMKDNVEEQSDVYLAYFGAFSPVHVGIDHRLPPAIPSSQLDRRTPTLDPGIYIISKNYLVGHPTPAPRGNGQIAFPYFGTDAFTYFADMTAIDSIGQSMCVYRVEAEASESAKAKPNPWMTASLNPFRQEDR